MTSTDSPSGSGTDFVREDGLLICGKCGEPKEMYLDVPFFPEPRKVGIMCRCGIEETDAEEKRRSEREHRERIERLRKDGVSKAMYQYCRFDMCDNKDSAEYKTAKEFTERFWDYKNKRSGLMFYGSVGTGKTFLAACIANELVDRGYLVVMNTIQDLAADMQENYGQNREYVLGNVRNCDLLILDDFGVERDTGYMAEQVNMIVNERYNANAPLIVTTNLSPKFMRDSEDDPKHRSYDRIFEMCKLVKMDGRSRRLEIGRERARESLRKERADASE